MPSWLAKKLAEGGQVCTDGEIYYKGALTLCQTGLRVK